MKQLTGRGAWVAFADAADLGGRAADIATIVSRAKRLGAEWVALRIGAAGMADTGSMERVDGVWRPRHDLVDALREAGLRIVVWLFEYAKYPDGSRPLWEAWVGVAEAALINAEFEYLDASRAVAEDLVSDLRMMGYECVVHAPPDYAGARGEKSMAVLDAICDHILPQVYAYEHNDAGHVHHLNAIRALYAARGLLQKVSPVLCTYRPRVRGFDKNNQAIKLTPIGDDKIAVDVVAGLDHEWTKASQCPSLYSIDALTFELEGHEAVIAAVEAYDAAHPRLPDTSRSDDNPIPPALRGEPEETATVDTVLDLVSKP